MPLVQDVIDIHTRHGLVPNPLYLRGARRVGCWPCVFARKDEVRLVARLSPDRIDEIEALEHTLTSSAGTQRAFFARDVMIERDVVVTDEVSGEQVTARMPVRTQVPTPIREYVDWSQTARGGKQLRLFESDEEPGCVRWGLCETLPTEE